jgi:hypothetical protein
MKVVEQLVNGWVRFPHQGMLLSQDREGKFDTRYHVEYV